MQSLEFLLTKSEIEQRYIRYCELIDHGKQFDRMGEVFTADTVGEYAQYNNVVHGLPDLIKALHFNLGPEGNCGNTQHNVGNFRIAVENDTAYSKAHFYAVHEGRNRFEGEVYSMWGEYEDRWIRKPEGWRVARRIYHVFLTQGPAGVVSRNVA